MRLGVSATPEEARAKAELLFAGGADFLKLIVHPDADLDESEEMRSINQDAVVIWHLWMGNLVCSNRSLQGVVKA